MKSKKLRTLVIFTFAGLSGALLLYTSQNVQQAENQLNEIQASINQEEETIRVLKAEWAYLNSPERLEALAGKYLDIKPAAASKIVTESSQLPVPLPPEEEGMMHEVAQEAPKAEPVKPSSVVKAPVREKDNFNALLNRLNDGGTQ